MKKFVTILLAATVLAAPMAQAQGRHDDRHRGVMSRKRSSSRSTVGIVVSASRQQSVVISSIVAIIAVTAWPNRAATSAGCASTTSSCSSMPSAA